MDPSPPMTMMTPSSPAFGPRSSSSTHKKPYPAAASIRRFRASNVAGFLGFAAKNRYKALSSDEYCRCIIQYSFRNFNTNMNNFLTIYVKFMTVRDDLSHFFLEIHRFGRIDLDSVPQKQQKLCINQMKSRVSLILSFLCRK